MKLNDYDVWLFDCDGVILDSNALKTQAFRDIGNEYGEKEAEALVNYHVEHGGESRYTKFDFFFKQILGKSNFVEDYERALEKFAELMQVGLRACPEVRGVRRFLKRLRSAGGNSRFVVSGSDGRELSEVLKDRGLSKYFDRTLGSPATKKEIVRGLLSSTDKNDRIVFVGDGRLDFEVSQEFGIDFVMIYGYSEWKDWQLRIEDGVTRARDFFELSYSV